MKKLLCFAVFILIFISGEAQSNGTFNVRNFGAKGDKSELATKFIQQAINQCAASGGGKVYFPPGEYLSGALELKSNVTIYLEAGAVIYASLDPADYDVPGKENRYRNPVLIYADGAENITIEGKGKIDGQARRIWTPIKEGDSFIQIETEIARKAGVEMSQFKKVEPHTFLVFLVNCKNVTVKDVTLYESCNWTLHLQWCKQVFINRVSIFSSLTEGVNADGIDVDGCSDVIISDCYIETDVKGLSITDFDLVWNEQSAEPRRESAFRFENIEDLWLSKISCRQAPGKVNPAIQLVNVKNGIAERCYAYPWTKTFFEISGNKTQSLLFRDNYLKNAEKATVILPEVAKQKIKFNVCGQVNQ